MKHSNLPRALVKGVVAALACGATGIACAATPGFYLSGSIGQSSADLDSSYQETLDEATVSAWESVGFDVLDGDSDLDKSDMGFELAVGYQFSQYFAVEAAYVDFGDSTYTAEGILSDGEQELDASTTVKAGVSGPALSLIGIWPFADRFALDARAGALFGKTKMTVGATLDTVSESQSESDSSTSLMFGAGISWSFSQAASVRLGYALAQDGVLDEVDVSRMSLSLRYTF